MPGIPEITYTKLFINNEFVDAVSGKTFPTINPATLKKTADIAEADKADVDLAVAAAKAAFPAWRKAGPSVRASLLSKLANLMERDVSILARLITVDNGSVITGTIGEAAFSAKIVQYYADMCSQISGKTFSVDGPQFTFTLREPIGVVGQISSGNNPILSFSGKLAPALAAGCTVVMKPAEQTPLAFLHAASLVKEAGFPPGVVNIIPGYGPTAGAAIAEHMDIGKVIFAGSVEVGKLVMAAAARPNLKQVFLELGGKSPLIILEDADVDEAVNIAQNSVMANQGQGGAAASRTFVHEKVYDEFVKKSVELASKRILGNPFDKKTTQGTQVDLETFNKVLNLIESGKREGAKLETGGERWGTEGYFIKPTVFSGVTDDMTIAKEEIFGPVQQILKFSTLEEAIERANNSKFGLGAGILTKDIDKALRFVKEMQAGNVWVNCYASISMNTPFGGYKESGFGKFLCVSKCSSPYEEYVDLIQLIPPIILSL